MTDDIEEEDEKDGPTIADLCASYPKLVTRLGKYDFRRICAAVGGLLTRVENHTATLRLEALALFAAVHCKGDLEPGPTQIRDFVNGYLAEGQVAMMQDPVEDEFVTNVIAWNGNQRVFEGTWQASGFYLQQALRSLVLLSGEAWARNARQKAIALLKLSEAIADRGQIARHSLCTSISGRPITVSGPLLDQGAARVSFSMSDLEGLGINDSDLDPFTLSDAQRDHIAEEQWSNTRFDHAPVVRTPDGVLVALPTAISPAIRHFICREAAEHGALERLEAAVADSDIREIMQTLDTGWRIQKSAGPTFLNELNAHEIVGTFDTGAHIHILVLHPPLKNVVATGFADFFTAPGALAKYADAQATKIADQPDYKRGMTLLVHGGLGGGFFVGFGEPAKNWQRASLSLRDFAMFGWDGDFSSQVAWKLLNYEDDLLSRGVQIMNVDGFVNLYAYALETNFLIWPGSAPNLITLSTDFQAPMRRRILAALDRHAARSADGSQWTEIQRMTTRPFFKEAEDLPLYVSPGAAMSGVLLGCIDRETRPWWVLCEDGSGDANERSAKYQIWEMCLNWAVRVSEQLSADTLPPGPVQISITFPDGLIFEETSETSNPLTVDVAGNTVMIACPANYMRAFRDAKNVGDRMMIAAMLRGFLQLAGSEDDDRIDRLVDQAARGDDARFLHAFVPRTPREVLHAQVSPPKIRTVEAVDHAIADFELANTAGWNGGAGTVPLNQASGLMKGAVNGLWARLKPRFKELNRRDLISRAVANIDAIERDRFQWRQTAAAILALHQDSGNVIAVATELEAQRAMASLAARVLVEMAICESDPSGGRVASDIELDRLAGDVVSLIDCASQDDGIHHGLIEKGPEVLANRSIDFDRTVFSDLVRPFRDAHGEREFAAHVASYPALFDNTQGGAGPDPAFEQAFKQEFGLLPEQTLDFIFGVARECVDANSLHLLLKKSELSERLSAIENASPSVTIESLALKPRSNWDEKTPANARARDWYPWRFNRRLAVARRPLLQLDEGQDPTFLVSPTLMDLSFGYILRAYAGRLPVELFDTEELRAWVGKAVDAEGHAFNARVAKRLRELGFEADPEVKLTALGGTKLLGDVDVLCWRKGSNRVSAIECKRLMMSRGVGEIAERLAEYGTTSTEGKRTPGQKHLDRVQFLRENPEGLAKRIGIDKSKLKIQSVLVSDYLVPMQFIKNVHPIFDEVMDFASIRPENL